MYYTINQSRIEQITAVLNADINLRVTEDDVRAELCADWNEGEEHQTWLDNAPVDEIVDWLLQFYD